MGEPDLTFSATVIRRALATYLPPAMVDIIMNQLGATLRENTSPMPTEEHHARTRALLRRWGINDGQN